MADNNLIYKRNGQFAYSGFIDPYIVQSAEELDGIPISRNAQMAWILGDGTGSTMKIRLPGGEWTEV